MSKSYITPDMKYVAAKFRHENMYDIGLATIYYLNTINSGNEIILYS